MYRSTQQRLRYLVQFEDADPKQLQQQQSVSTPIPARPFGTAPSAPKQAEPVKTSLPDPGAIEAFRCNFDSRKLSEGKNALHAIATEEVSLANAKDKPKSAAELPKELGLVAQGGQPMPLQAVQVRAHLLDLVAKVVVLQQYQNLGTEMVESKFVFPLDEHAAVCGFEVEWDGVRAFEQSCCTCVHSYTRPTVTIVDLLLAPKSHSTSSTLGVHQRQACGGQSEGEGTGPPRIQGGRGCWQRRLPDG